MSQTDSAKSDEELMKDYQMGDYSSFEILYRRHSGRVYSFLRKRLNRKEDLDEVYQLVFAKLHDSRLRYDPSHAFAKWLFVITKTVLLDHWRKSQRRANEVSHSPEEMDSLPSSSTEVFVFADADARDALRSLGADQRQALELRVLDEMSYREIAQKLRRSEVSVRQLVSRALKKVRQVLAAENEAGGSQNGGLR